jgi:FtsH-binding integral membrane protein
MRRLTLRDLVATLLVLAIAIPYVGYLINGEMPFIEDPQGMSAVGLLLGAAAFLVLRTGDEYDRAGKVEAGVALAALVLGLVALAFAETAAAEWLLAAFMVSILVVFVMELLDHSGAVHWHGGGAPTHA